MSYAPDLLRDTFISLEFPCRLVVKQLFHLQRFDILLQENWNI